MENTTPSPINTTTANNNNSFSHIFMTIIIPIVVLNKGSKFGLSPLQTLVIALMFPLFSGLRTLLKNKKMDYMALLGLVNVLVSGTLALLALGGIWFAIKEALFPLLIGAFVLFSSFGAKPFFETLFLNPTAFDVSKIETIIQAENKTESFNQLMKKATQWLSISFLMSAILNYILALYIFTPLSESLSTEEKQVLLNEQLSQMHLYSLLVILIPSILFLGGILFFTFKRIRELTGLTTDDLFIKS